jgi:Mg-chelatase subunit ChlD
MRIVRNLLFTLIFIIMLTGLAEGVNVEISSYPSQTTVGGNASINVITVNNTIVNFTTTLGNLNASSAMTNSLGNATIIINSTASGIAIVNASVGSDYNTTNVTFLPEKPARIDVNVSQNTLVVGNTTIVNLIAYDQYNNTNSTANLTLNIQISDILGEVINQVNITGTPYVLTQLVANRSNVTLTNSISNTSNILLSINSTVAGNITITATAENITNTFNITFTPAALSYISLEYINEQIVNLTSIIKVNAWDMYENPINNTIVIFNATPPLATKYNSPIDYNSQNLSPEITYTDLSGFASTVYRNDKRAGDNTINISVGGINTSITIKGIADEASDIHLSHAPETVYANNRDTYTLMAQVVDKFLNPVYPKQVPIKEKVLFSTPIGSTLIPLNDSGVAVTRLGPTPYIQTVNISSEYITETYSGIINYTILNFTTGDLNRFVIYTNPNTVLSRNIRGNHNTTITFYALDESGHPIPDINITLNNTNVSLGDLIFGNDKNIINATTDIEGRIVAEFTSKIPSGNATIVVSNGSINSSIIVYIKDEPFLSATITFEPNSTINSGDIVNITTIITAEGEVPISRPAASALLVLDRSGSMDPDYYAGTPLDVALVLDRSGSMSGTPLADVKTASKAFINNLVSNSQVGVVSYSTTSGVDIGLTLLNSLDNKIPVRNAIDGLSAGGTTAMGEGMADANTMLVNGRSNAKKIMIVLTDGNTNEGTDQEGLNAILFANANDITIYTIGLGNDLNEPILQNIAVSTGGKYYNAPTSSDLANIYNSIAQEISDFDVSQIHYGVDGFTPYNYQNQSSVNAGTTFEYTFQINETINDLKVQLDWINVSSNLNMTLISPGGHVYGAGNDTVGYYYNDGSTVLMNTTEYIWINPLNYTYPDDDQDAVEYGDWTVRVSGNRTEQFNITTYIDKKSAVKLGSFAFMSSFDENRGDKTGLSLYSFDSVNSSLNQTSFLRGGSTWTGYFTVNSNGIYNFNLSWDDASNLNISLYDGATVLNSSNGSSNPEIVSSTLSIGKNYHIMISKDQGITNDTQFTINVSSSNSRSTMTTYYDSNTYSPRYRQWDGTLWLSEASAKTVLSQINWIVMQSNPVRNEIILGTLDTDKDLNVQVWDGISWGAVQEISTNEYSSSTRGFDIAFEENSGNAMVVYNNNSNFPRYRLWNGSAWSNETAVTSGPGSQKIKWVRLVARPNSNEILLAYLDSNENISAQIWNGSVWNNVTKLTTTASTSDYQSFDAVYEQGTGKAKVVWGESNKSIRISTWNGTSWSAASTIFTDSYSPYWIKLASDPKSNNILMGEENIDYDININEWNGSNWSSVLNIENDVGSYSRRIMDVAFEGLSSKGLVVWGDKTTTPKYRKWDNNSWSGEFSASSHGGDDTRWVQLSPDPFSNKMFLITSDKDDDINIQQWNGSAWSNTTEVEKSSSDSYESFDLTYQRHNLSIEQIPVNWIEWRASVTSTFNDTISHLNNSIDTMTADGLTAIDEGIFEANNELASISANSTIVLMTDGLDNAGYHSMLFEAQRAKNHNTTIYTIGFGNNESEVDPVLSEIANITGGKYYFAPNASILKSIFRGIASNITNFTAEGPTLNMHIPYNYISGLSLATSTYVVNSSNSTNGSQASFIIPTYPQKGNAEPNITTQGNISVLSWKLPNLNPGDKWGIWYQQKVQGAGYVPLMLDTSNITYNDLFGSYINVNIISAPGVNLGGGGAGVSYIALGNMQLIANPPVIFTHETSSIMVTAIYADGNPAIANVTFDTNLGYFNNLQNPLNNITVSGSNFVNFTSITAGQANINAIGSNGNNSVWGNVVIVVKPKGKIIVS